LEILQGFIHLNHASLKYQGDKIIYVDPFKIAGSPGDADYIFCTHDHFDHLSMEDIKKLINPGTIVVVPQKNVRNFKKMEIAEAIGVEPGMAYEAGNLKFNTIPAYNLDKKFHKKKNNWVGFIITINNFKYYFAGDTDYIPEMDAVEADVVFLPVGGTYTMNAHEAARAANYIKPKVAVPIHFGSVVGSRQDAEKFLEELDEGIQGTILSS